MDAFITEKSGVGIPTLTIENKLRISGIDVNEFLGTNTNGAAYDTSVGHNPASGQYEGDVYVLQDVFLAYPDETNGSFFIRLSSVLSALFGINVSTIEISPEKRSLHRLDYTVGFEVDAGVVVQVEDFVADVEVSGNTLVLQTDASFLISDNTNDQITPFVTQSLFKLTQDVLPTITKTSSVVTDYDWLKDGITTNTFFKGLFGEFLAESPVVTVIRDSNLDNIISNATLNLLVTRPTRHQEAVIASGEALWSEIYYKLEHEALLQELSAAFLNVWSNSDNMDWYTSLFNHSNTGTLFNTNDEFQVPVELTLRYQLGNNAADLDGLQGFQNLNPLGTKTEGAAAGTIPKIQKTFRILYKFNVIQEPNQILESNEYTLNGLLVLPTVFPSVYYKVGEDQYVLIPSTTTATTTDIAIFNNQLSMNLSTTETNSMTFYEQFLTTGTQFTLAEIQALGTTVEYNQDVYLQNQFLDLSEFFTSIGTTNFTTVYKKATNGTYVQVNALEGNFTTDPEVTASLAIFSERLFNYTGTTYEEISFTSGGVDISTIDTTDAVFFNTDSGINLPL